VTSEIDDVLVAIDDVATGMNFDVLTSTHDADASFPWTIWEALVELGLPTLEMSEAHGGLNWPVSSVARVLERLAYHSIAASTAYFTFTGFGSHVIAGLDANHPLRSLLGSIATGEVRTALSLTEPGGGSDLASMRTRLDPDGNSWRLRGAKMYTTLAGEATHLVVGALVPGEESWSRRMAFAVVNPAATGVTIARVSTQALRTCPTYEVAYDDVRVERDDVIAAGVAFPCLMAMLNLERIAVAAQSCGLAARALDDALAYARVRESGSGTLTDFQVVRHQLAEAWQALNSARALLDAATRRIADGDKSGVLPTMAGRQAAMAAYQIADLNVQLHGGSGLTTAMRAQRLWRDTRLHLIGPVPQAVSADYLARQLMTHHGSIRNGER
jgi:alkylation response protein AidB-like acyl-CoA dehydrogenase